MGPPTAAVGIVRGPIIFALHPRENRTVVKTFPSVPARPHAVDYQISTNDPWNYAIAIDKGARFVSVRSPHWSPSFPFDDSGEFPFSVTVSGRRASSWGYWSGSKITEPPPASPIDIEMCGVEEELQLVPFGSTNIRISVF